jgi:hypothetical protein
MTGVKHGKGSVLRIWHQSVNELDHLAVHKRALEAHAAEILDDDDAEVIVFGISGMTANGSSRFSIR